MFLWVLTTPLMLLTMNIMKIYCENVRFLYWHLNVSQEFSLISFSKSFIFIGYWLNHFGTMCNFSTFLWYFTVMETKGNVSLNWLNSFSLWRFLSYRNQYIDWRLYDRGLRHENLKKTLLFRIGANWFSRIVIKRHERFNHTLNEATNSESTTLFISNLR